MCSQKGGVASDVWEKFPNNPVKKVQGVPYQNDLNPIHVHPDGHVQILAPSIGRTVLEPPWLGPGPGCSQIHVAKTVVLPRLADPDGAGLNGRVCLNAAGTAGTKVVSKAMSWCFAHFAQVSCESLSFY